MIPVVIRRSEIPLLHGDWLQRAEGLRLRVIAATRDELSLLINSNPIWQELIPTLRRWSYEKCWYTEAKTIKHGGRFDVDHFRPKLGAVDPWHSRRWEGYPWLAFTLDNFRLAVVAANRLEKDEREETRGKGTLFPLRDPDSPVASLDTGIGVEDFHVALLDPCCEHDAAHLSFNEDGRCVCLRTNDPWVVRRVARTVDVYNLDHPGFVEGRQDVIRYCKKLIKEIKRWQTQPANDDREHTLRELENQLTLMFRADQEYAGAARAYARKCGHDWVLQRSQSIGAPPYTQPAPPPPPPSPPPVASADSGAQLSFSFAETALVVLSPRPAMPPAPKKPKIPKKQTKTSSKTPSVAVPTASSGPLPAPKSPSDGTT